MAMTTKGDERVHMLVLPDELLRHVKARAAARGETMRAWFERAIRAQIKTDGGPWTKMLKPSEPAGRRGK